MLNRALEKYNDVIGSLRVQQKTTDSALAALQTQYRTDTGAAASRANAVDAQLSQLERRSLALHKTVGLMDHKMAPVLLAHLKSEADTARLATAARNAARAARRAQYSEDIAAGLVIPDRAWEGLSSSDEGKKSASRLPSLAKFIGDTEKLDITTFFNALEMWFEMSKYSQSEKSSNAILHLDGKTQKQWWPMETKLRRDGLDPQVFSVFKTAMLTRWAPVAPGLNGLAFSV